MVKQSAPDDLVLAIEQATAFRGRYFVLLGRLSPLDGIGPEALGLDRLAARLQSGEIVELILATNPTVEGEATAHYIGELAREQGVRVPGRLVASAKSWLCHGGVDRPAPIPREVQQQPVVRQSHGPFMPRVVVEGK